MYLFALVGHFIAIKRKKLRVANFKKSTSEETEADVDDFKGTRVKCYNILTHALDNPLQTLFVVMLTCVIPFVIDYILFPNYLPMSILEFLRTSSAVSDIQLTLAMFLTFVIPLKVPEWGKNTKNAIVTFILNCMIHSEMRTLNEKTEMVHGRARAPSRQTLRVAANEVRSRVAPRKGADLFFYCLKREFLRGTWSHIRDPTP